MGLQWVWVGDIYMSESHISFRFREARLPGESRTSWEHMGSGAAAVPIRRRLVNPRCSNDLKVPSALEKLILIPWHTDKHIYIYIYMLYI